MTDEIDRDLWRDVAAHDWYPEWRAMTDAVDHPKHYNSHPSGVECIEIVRHMTFNTGSVFKYLWRAGLKDTAPLIEDHKKALWFLKDEIGRLERAEREAKRTLEEAEQVSKTETDDNLSTALNYFKNTYGSDEPRFQKQLTVAVMNKVLGNRSFAFDPDTPVGTAAAKVAETYGYASFRDYTLRFSRAGSTDYTPVFSTSAIGLLCKNHGYTVTLVERPA